MIEYAREALQSGARRNSRTLMTIDTHITYRQLNTIHSELQAFAYTCTL